MRRLIICAFVIILTAASGWLSYTTYQLWRDPNTLPMAHVQVEGQFRYVTRASVEQEVLPFVQNGFLHVDVAALREKLIKNQAVKEVRIVRVWPDKLWIEVIEHHFVARWKEVDSQQIGLVNDQGMVIEIAPNQEDQSLPLLIAPLAQTKQLLQTLQQLDKKLGEINLSVTELALDHRHALKAKLDNNIWLFLGRDTTLARVQRFVQVYEKLTPKISGKMSYIDLRYTNGIAVKIDNL